MPEVVAAVVVAPVPDALAVAAPCDCNAETRFWMKACIACCGVLVPEVAALVSEALVAPALIAAVALASVVVEVAEVPAAAVAAVVEVRAPDWVRACIKAANRPPAGGDCAAPGVLVGAGALVAPAPELGFVMPIMPIGYC